MTIKGTLLLSLPVLLATSGLACADLEDAGFDEAFDLDADDYEFRAGAVPCSGAPEASILGIGLPQAPHTAPPAVLFNPVVVDNVADLEAQIALAGTLDIIVVDGVYPAADLSGDYLDLRGKRLWAQTSGGVVFEFGVNAGGNNTAFAGGELHGIVFDVDSTDHMVPYASKDEDLTPITAYAVISSWGLASHLVVEDCEIDGHGQAYSGVLVAAPMGVELRRLEIQGIRRHGIQLNGPTDDFTPSPVPQLEHISIWDVRDPLRDSWGVGIWLGEHAELDHVRVRDVRWAGIVNLEDSDQSMLEHIDVDQVGGGSGQGGGVGVYFDLQSTYVTLDSFCVGPKTRIGVNSEWDNLGNPHGHLELPRAQFNVVQKGVIESALMGVHFDQGTIAGDVNNVTFRNYSRAAITFFHNLAIMAEWPPISGLGWPANGSTQANNTFQEVEQPNGPCDLSFTLWNVDPVVCE